jgi:hypothetical protein
MRRRTFIAGLGSASAWPLVARAQQPGMPVIGFLNEPLQRYNACGTGIFWQFGNRHTGTM